MSRIADALNRVAGAPAAELFDERDHPWAKDLDDLRGNRLNRADTPSAVTSPRSPGQDPPRNGTRPATAVAPAAEGSRSALDPFSPAMRAQLSTLVSQMFLPASGEPPHSVAFCSVDLIAPSGPLVSAAAELLAEQTTGSVCLLDAKYSAPSLHDYFGINQTPGFHDGIGAGLTLAALARPVRRNLFVLPAGSTDGGVTAMNNASRTQLPQLFAAFDHVLVDVDSVLTRGTGGLVTLVDAVILVMAAESTRREAGRRATELLRHAGAAVAGVILTDRRFPIPERLYRRL